MMDNATHAARQRVGRMEWLAMSRYSKEYLEVVLAGLPVEFTPRDLQAQINVSQKRARSILRHAESYGMAVNLGLMDKWRKANTAITGGR